MLYVRNFLLGFFTPILGGGITIGLFTLFFHYPIILIIIMILGFCVSAGLDFAEERNEKAK